MARKVSARVVYNRQVADALRLGIADGMLAVCEAIVEQANPPDATPFGEGLVTTGAAGAWIDGRKVGGTSPKPRHDIPSTGIVAIAGWGFPGRFQELGTIHHGPQPFALPPLDAVVPNTASIMAPHVRARVS